MRASENAAGDSDLDLVHRAQRSRGTPEGDAAFVALVDRLKDRTFFQILRRTGDREKALELVQETVARVYEALPRFEPRASVRAWVGRIAHNLCVDAIRERAGPRRVRSLQSPAAASKTDSRDGELGDRVASPDAGTVDRAILAEDLGQLATALDELPPIYREIVALRVHEGLAYAEIAAITGTTEGAAKERMCQALRLLRERLAP